MKTNFHGYSVVSSSTSCGWLPNAPSRAFYTTIPSSSSTGSSGTVKCLANYTWSDDKSNNPKSISCDSNGSWTTINAKCGTVVIY